MKIMTYTFLLLGTTLALQSSAYAANPAQRFADEICDKLIECNSGLRTSRCMRNVMTEPQLGAPFIETYGDLDYDSTVTLQDLSDGFEDGVYTVAEADVNTCINYLSSQSCGDAGTNLGKPMQFGNVENMVEPPCEKIVVINDSL